LSLHLGSYIYSPESGYVFSIFIYIYDILLCTNWELCYVPLYGFVSHIHVVDVPSSIINFFKLFLVCLTTILIRFSVLYIGYFNLFPASSNSMKVHFVLLYNLFLFFMTLSCSLVFDKKMGIFAKTSSLL